MNRRGFLAAIGATASGLVLPEPRRVYSFPSSWWLERSRALTINVFHTFHSGLDRSVLRAELEQEIYGALAAPSGGSLEHVKAVVRQTLERHRAFIPGLSAVVVRGKVMV